MNHHNMLKKLEGKLDRNGQPRHLLADHTCDILEDGMVISTGPAAPGVVREVLYHALSFLYPGEREARIADLLYAPGDLAVRQASEVVDMFHCIANSSGDIHKPTEASAMLYISRQKEELLWALWAILEAYADQPLWMYPTKNHYTGFFMDCSGYTAYLTAVRTYLDIRHPEAEGS